jgi:DNA polymerase/3'-5' exonuclease PolX
MELKSALEIAEEYTDLLKECATQIDYTGAIRRGESEVTSISYLVLPKGYMLEDHIYMSRKRKLLQVAKNKVFFKKLYYKNASIDITIGNPLNYGILHALTTGNRKYNRVIYRAIKERQMYWGGINGVNSLNEYLRKKDGSIVETPDEREFFETLKLKYIEPVKRKLY